MASVHLPQIYRGENYKNILKPLNLTITGFFLKNPGRAAEYQSLSQSALFGWSGWPP